MNERFLSKAKRLDNGEWIEGYYGMKDDDTHLIMQSTFNQYSDNLYFTDYKIDPSTLCQCTGLKDKNGKLMYENDIVMEYHSEGQQLDYPHTIIWDDGFKLQGKWMPHPLETKGTHKGGNFSYDYKCTFEIIGNTHDKEEE